MGQKVKKSRKIRKDQETLISPSAKLLDAMTQV